MTKLLTYIPMPTSFQDMAVTSVTGETSGRAAARGSKFFPNDVEEAIT
jgi:hypothetical protein